MSEAMILAYLEQQQFYYEIVVSNVAIKGDEVQYLETSTCGHYRERKSIDLLDLITWVWVNK